MMFLAVSALSVIPIYAQMETVGVKAEIPNSFVAGETRLPAGTYTVVPISVVDKSLELKDVNNKVSVLLIADNTLPPKSPNASEIVFDKIGNDDFMREIRTENHVYQLEKSHREMALEKQGMKSVSHTLHCTPCNE